MKSNDPPRLRHDPEASALLRMALEVNADEPSGSDLRALGVSLGLAPISLLAPAAHKTHLAAKAAAGVKIKWISTIIAPALVGAATATTVLKVTEPLRQERQVQVPTESGSAPPSLQRTSQTAEPIAAPLPIVPTSAEPPPALAPLPRASSMAKERSLPPPPPVAPIPDDPVPPRPATTPESEIRLLERAKAQIESDPRGALALVDEHARRFSTGMLQQEAEVIAIEALVRAGSRQSAADRLAKFRQRFPGSAYLPHLETVMRTKN